MEAFWCRFLLLLFLGPLHLYGEEGEQGDCASHSGHLRPLGSHRDPEGSIDAVDGFLEPEKFYEEYVKPGRPLLFRGAAKALPAYQYWDDSYLQDKYGRLLVDVETKKKEDRLQDVHTITMSEFLEQYKKRDIYMVHDVPAEMDEELGLPKPLLCGGFQDVLQTAIMWFSSGGTRSVLHSDDVDNVNCLIDGEKDLIMIDKAFRDDVEADGFQLPQSFSKVDVDAVDFEKFPRLKGLPWWKVEMKKGDCLFIPVKWYHQVNSRGRNLAVNLWFFHLLWFNQSDCDEYAKHLQHQFIPLSHYTLNGPESPEYARSELFHPFKDLNLIKVEDVQEKWGHILSSLEVHEVFQLLDVNKDFLVSWEEVYLSDPDVIGKTFPHLLPDYFYSEKEAASDEPETDDPNSHFPDEL